MNFKFIISDIICINDAYWGFFCLSSFFNFTIKMINAHQYLNHSLYKKKKNDMINQS